MNSTFIDEASEFNAYMQSMGNINAHSRTNYLSWLRFLSQNYLIDSSLSADDVENIINSESEALGTRPKYNTTKDLTNFRSALNKYLAYLTSGYTDRCREVEQKAVEDVQNQCGITDTTRLQIIEARVGQGLFRQELIDFWHGCAVSRCTAVGLLMASHIKPWCVADNHERLDVYNGLLLLPNIDRLFDKGYITFTDRGAIRISSFITPAQYTLFGITPESHLVDIRPEHQPYLDYHRHQCFIGL